MAAAGHSSPTPARIMQMGWGYAPPLMIEAAVQHGFFDALDKGSKTAAEVASETSTSPRGALMILNALAGLELLSRDSDGRFTLAPDVATFLVRGKPTFFGGMLRHTSIQLIPRWLKIGEIVKNGGPASDINSEASASEFFTEFVADLFPISYAAARALAGHLQLDAAPRPAKVLDVASGSGVWGIALAQSAPQVTVTAVDFPAVLKITRQMAGRFGLDNRFAFTAGDLFDVDFGSDFQVATLGHILHTEGEARNRLMLQKCFDALAPGGTIAIAEFLVDDDRSGPPSSLIFAVNMLVNTAEGNTYSFHEIAGWLRDAGFENPRLLDAPGPSPLVLATKPV